MSYHTQNFIIPPTGSHHEIVSKYDTSSPWKSEDVAFNVQNICYPTLHSHEYYEILVILSGSTVHCINDFSYTMRRGDCCLVRPEDRHNLNYPQDTSLSDFLSINFMLTPTFYNKAISNYDSDPIPTTQQHKAPLTFRISNSVLQKIQTTCLHIQMPVNQPSIHNVRVCKAMVSELLNVAILTYLTKDQSDCPAWLQSLMLDMQKPENISKKPSELIQDVPYSRSYIEKKFRRHFGVSILEFKTSAKMAYAKELLGSSNASIAQITRILGFDSPSHFSTLFKKNYGISPIQFRNETR